MIGSGAADLLIRETSGRVAVAVEAAMVFSNLSAFLVQNSNREAIADIDGVVQGDMWRTFIQGFASALERDEMEVNGELRRARAQAQQAQHAASSTPTPHTYGSERQ